MLSLTCPKCLEEAVIRVDLDDGETLTCSGCDETYKLDQVRALVAGWGRIIPWLDLYPAKKTPGPVLAAV